jgi:tRNA-2-methylthio-N6-dimethylallyladenosine synthase
VFYENIFAFSYSPRPFTKAARFTDQIPDDVKSRRLQRLLSLHNQQTFERAKDYQGRVLSVLVEEHKVDTGRCIGRSTQNKTVHFPGQPEWVGLTKPVRINEAFPQTLRGVVEQI